jgi:hypothetical protein
MMIKTLLFSKNRAMQLDATLHSLYLHCEDINLAEIHVLYSATTPQYAAQYRLLERAYPQINFVGERSFREDVEEILLSCYKRGSQRRGYRFVSRVNRLFFIDHSFITKVLRKLSKLGIRIETFHAPKPSGESHILFLVDDNIFVRHISLQRLVKALHSVPKAIGFSLRLGRNTDYTYMLNSSQELPGFEIIDDDILAYDWQLSQYDFNYPLEVSSSLYRAAQIIPLLVSFRFSNPNTLEGEMAARSRWFAKEFPKLLCFDTSVAFCNPVNKVQTLETGNRAGLIYEYTVEELADRFDKGMRIDIESYNDYVSNSCHQEIELKFKVKK